MCDQAWVILRLFLDFHGLFAFWALTMAPHSSSIDMQEEDIGNISPYSIHNSPSSTTIESSNGDLTVDELVTDRLHGTPRSEETPTQTTFSAQVLQPSLSRRGDSVMPISRAQTLPPESKSPSSSDISNLDVDASQVAKMRRWILGVAVGE